MIDQELLKAVADSPFPILELARFLDWLIEEVQKIDNTRPDAAERGRDFLNAISAIRQLSESYTKIANARDGVALVH